MFIVFYAGTSVKNWKNFLAFKIEMIKTVWMISNVVPKKKKRTIPQEYIGIYFILCGFYSLCCVIILVFECDIKANRRFYVCIPRIEIRSEHNHKLNNTLNCGIFFHLLSLNLLNHFLGVLMNHVVKFMAVVSTSIVVKIRIIYRIFFFAFSPPYLWEVHKCQCVGLYWANQMKSETVNFFK